MFSSGYKYNLMLAPEDRRRLQALAEAERLPMAAVVRRLILAAARDLPHGDIAHGCEDEGRGALEK